MPRKRRTNSTLPKRPQFEELEPRILHSADLASQADAVQAEVEVIEADEAPTPQPSHQEPAQLSSDDFLQLVAAGEPITATAEQATEAPHQLIVIDTSVQDYQTFVYDISSQIDGHYDLLTLNSTGDGFEQIKAHLHSADAQYDAIHIISHGTDRALKLAGEWITESDLSGQQDALQAIGTQLTADADLLFYACNLGSTTTGQSMLDHIALWTGADVAASVDGTGHSDFGGNWELEYIIGQVESRNPFSASVQDNWNGLLSTFTVTTTTDGGAGSLRQAIIDANSLGGADTITLGSNTYTLTIGGIWEDAAATGDLDITSDITITGTGMSTTIIDGNSLDRVFDVQSGSLTLQDLKVTGGYANNYNGGAINILSGATATLTDVDIDGNQNATAGQGGAIYNAGTFNMTGGMIRGNSSVHQGAAIANLGTVTLSKLSISGNTSSEGSGSGLYNSGGNATVTNVTISGNTAKWNGAGITNNGGTTTVEYSTIAHNHLTDINASGGGIYNASGTVNLLGSIVANNTSAGYKPDFGGTITSQGYNLIEDVTDGGTIAGDTTGNITGVDPNIAALADNGGNTLTHALNAGSQAIDNGGGAAPATDARGVSRGGTPDIGAYEANIAPVLNNTPSITLATVSEDAAAPVGAVGTLISDIVDFVDASGWDNVTDADTGAVTGIALTATDTTYGTWHYTTDGGTNWYAAGAVSNISALLLAADANTRLYFKSGSNYNGTLASAITFRAWDQTSGSNGGTADTSANGGATAFSTATDTASITVTAVNDAPSFNAAATPSFSPHDITTSATGAYSVGAYDIDNDGDLDVVSASSGDNTIAWYENDGSENFTKHNVSTTASGALSVFAADVDGDGDIDLLSASSMDDSIRWYENDGSENFTAHTITNTADYAASVTAIDLDGDGDMDVLSASNSDNTIAWYENDGSENFTAHNVSTTTSGALSVHAADVDGDGDLDILSAGYGNDTVSWHENDGSENFTEHVITNSAIGATAVTTIDVDGDGDLDVISSSFLDDTVAWYENDGSENFTTHVVTSTADGARMISAGDMDDDGDIDLLSASYMDDSITWYENDGSESFTARVISNSAVGARSVAIGDGDSDGDIDVLSASETDASITWYESDLSSLDGNPTFIENGSAVVLDTNVEVLDAELTAADNFNGATLTLVRNGGANADDVFSNSGTLGALTQSGNLTVSATTIGTVTTNSSGSLVLTFNSNATNALVNSALQQITYSNSSDTPPASVEINWSFSDGNSGAQGSGGALQAAGSTTVNITAVNDAPTAANNTVTTNEDTDYTFSASDFNYSDGDGDALASVKITSLESAGALKLSGVDVTLNQVITKADIDLGNLVFTPAANANGVGYDSFGFSVNDATSDSVASYTMTVDVTAVNDAPVLAGANNLTTILEDPGSNPGTLVSALIAGQITDVDSGASAGIAVTAVDNTNGSWQYSTNSGSTWNGFGSPSNAAALLLTNNASTYVRFVPDANWSGTVSGGLTFRAWDQTSGSAGSTANTTSNGGTTAFSSATASADITVTSVNDAPAGADKTVSTNEDTDYTFSVADFGFTDPNDAPADALTAVKITTLPVAGSLKLNGVAVSAGQTVAVADINSNLLVFSPAANANGVGYASFTFEVQDDGGTANGGVDLDASANTITIDVTAVNDAPTAANNTVSTNEDTGYTFSASDFNFSDIDGDTLASVKITSLESAGALKLSGVDVTLNQVITKADIDLGNLVFTPAANANGVGYDSFGFSVNDGTTDSVASYSMTVDVTAVNDAPAGADKTVSTNEDTDYTFSAADFGFTDPNDAPADALTAVKITTLPAAGSLKLNGVAVSAGQTVSVADINSNLLVFSPAANTNGVGYASFTFQVQDDGGTANGGVDLDASANTITIDVTAVNDAPTAANNTVSTNEDTDYTFNAADFNFSDIDGDTLASVKITSLESAGALKLSGVDVTLNQVITKADIDLGNLVFTPAANANANANGVGYDSFGFSVNDGTTDSVASYTLTVDVTAVNDAPTAANNTVTTNEDTDYTFSAADFNFSDVDGDTLASVKITSLESAGALKLSGVDVTLNQVITKADIDLGNLVFTPAANANGVGYDSFGFSANDGITDSVASYTLTIDVTAVNDAPTAANNTVSTNEDTDYTFSASDFNFSDIDGDTLASVKITSLESAGALKLSGVDVTLNQVITKADIDLGNLVFTPVANANGAGYDSFGFSVNDGTTDSVASYTLTVDVTAVNDTPTASNNTVTTNEDTDYTFSASDFNFSDVDGDTLASVKITSLESAGTLKLSGIDVTLNQIITKADIDLGNLVFSPVPGASGVSYDSFDFSVNDGSTDSVASYTLTVDVTAVNDAPTAANNTVTTNEDTDYTFSAADFNFSDVDGDTLASVKITSLESAGALKLSGVDVTLNQIITKADIDLGNLVFTPAANANGVSYDSFGFSVNDGITDSVASYTMTLDVTAVNDAPTAANNTVTTNEDTDYTFNAADFNFSDVDGDTLASVKITSLESAGALKLSGVDVTLNQVITKADIDLGNLVFTPAANANGVGYDSFGFSVNDGTTDSIASYTLTVDVTAVNDVPTAANNTVSTNEDTDYTFNAADFNFSDIDGDTLASVKITSLESAGALKLSGVDVTLNQIITKADIDLGNLVFTPAANANGVGYDSFGFSVNDGTADSAASYTLTVDVASVNDAPTAANNTVSTNEDTAYTFNAADFNFSDIDGDTLASVKITSLESAGALKLSGVDVTLNQVITKADIDLGNLVFTPAANANGVGYDSFGFSVNDGSTDSVASYTMTVDVSAVNDDPYTSVALPSDISVTEDVTSDVDLSVINLVDIDAGASSISVTLTTAAGLLTATTGGGVTVTGSGTTSLLLQGSVTDLNTFFNTASNISYLHPTGNTFGDNTDTITVVANDGGNTGSGGGGNISLGTVNVDISGVNDTPINQMPGSQVTNVDTAIVLSGSTAIQVSDVDAGAAVIRVTLTATDGIMSLNGTTGLTFSTGDGSNDAVMTFDGTVADINAALDGMSFDPTTSFEGEATITILTDDLGNTGSGGAQSDSDVLSIHVGGISFQEGVDGYTGTEDTYVRSTAPNTDYGANSTVAVDDQIDIDNGANMDAGLLRFGNLIGGGAGQVPLGSTINSATLSIYVTNTDALDTVQIHQMLAGWNESSTYNSLGSGVTDDNAEAATAPIAILDAGISGWISIDVSSAVQTWATGTSNNGFVFFSNDADMWSFASSENGTTSIRPVLNISYTPPQPPALTTSGGTASYTENGAGVAIDPSLTLSDTDSTNLEGATVSITNNHVNSEDLLNFTDQNGITGSFNATTGVLTLTGTSSVANYQTALRSITYSNSSDDPSTATREISFQVDDAYVSSSVETRSVDITVVNDAPTLSQTPQAAISYTEGDGQTAIDTTLVTGDVDDTIMQGATIQITSGYAGAEDVLHFTNQNGITGSLVGDTLTLSGPASLADYQTALRSITYENTSEDPTGGTRTITFIINDGGLDSGSVSRDITVTPVNDEQSLDTNAGLSLNEGATAGISNAELSTSDVDNTAAQLTYTVTSAPGNGQLELTTGPGVPIASFTQDDIDSGRLVYVHDDSETTTDSFDFSVDDGAGASSSGTFNISITLLNDNTPVVDPAQSFNLSESAANTTSVGTATATDADTGATLGSWSIVSGNADGIFQINAGTGEITVLDNSNLDYESQTSYSLGIQVSDGTFTSATETVTVNITDENDTAPVITGGQSFGVSETAANGTSVGTVAATDADTVGSLQNWAITAGDPGGAFQMNAATGEITVLDNAQLDYESSTSFTLTVTVEDGVNTSASETVTINLSDENDTAPVITPAQSFSVSELASNGTSVGTALATDADTVGSLQNWSIAAGNTDGIFQVNASTGEITVLDNSNLDFDATPSYTLTLTVEDGVNTSATETVTINVTDEIIAVTPAQSFTISESDPNGTAVGTVLTTGDAPTGFTIIAGNTGSAFAIDASGNITINDSSAIDYESTTSFTLTVEASDGTNTDSDTVTINLTDENDTAPVVTPAQSFSVSELASNSDVVGTPTATDADTVGSLQSWTITAGDPGGIFSINASTGQITVADASQLDFDTTPSYSLTVTVSDGVNTSAGETMTINVIDEVVTVDTGQTFVINENDANGTAVGTVTTSGDSPVSFAILAGNTGGAFSINASGDITINDSSVIDYESATSFSLTVEAFDGSNTDSQVVTVNITDFDEYDVGAVADTNLAINTVAEDAAIGSLVGITAGATDLDGTDSVSYSLSDDAGGLFQIDALTGVVTVNGALDAETATSHSITVVATSTDTSTSSQGFTITISDVDEFDVGPIVDTDATANAVDENAMAGTAVGITASASDADQSNNTISYSLLDDAGGLFSIDSSSGVVSVATPPDYETASSHSIIVQALSADGSSSSQSFTVNINPLNDTSPDLVAQTVNINEDDANGSIVVDLRDETTLGDNEADGDAITYSLISGNEAGAFAIDSATGVVTLVNTTLVDFETTASYALEVQASDGTFSTTATLTVNVNNINEAPVLNTPASVSIDEDTPLTFSSSSAQSLSVSDPDSGTQDIEVTLSASNGVLTLGDQSTLSSIPVSDALDSFTLRGSVAAINLALEGLQFTPDADYNGTASITLHADDLGNSGSGPALTDSETITITIVPVNDEPALDVPDLVELVPGESIDFSTALNNLSPLEDLDSQTTTHNLSLSIENATLSIADDSLLPSLTLNDGAHINASGDIATINEILNALVITPDVGFNGDLILDLYLEDEGGVDVGSARSLSTQIRLFVPAPPIDVEDRDNREEADSEDDVVELLPADLNIAHEAPRQDDDNEDFAINLEVRELAFDLKLNAHGDVFKTRDEIAHTLEADEGGHASLFNSRVLGIGPFNTFNWLGGQSEFNDIEPLTFSPSLQGFLLNGLDDANSEEKASIVIKLAEFTGAGFLVGSVIWVLKGSSLLSSLLVSYPAWRGMDPLPVLLPRDGEHLRPKAPYKEKPRNPRFQLEEQTGYDA